VTKVGGIYHLILVMEVTLPKTKITPKDRRYEEERVLPTSIFQGLC